MTSHKRPDPMVIGARLRAEREATPYWSRGKLARLLRDAADPRERDDIAHVPSLTDMIKQWENGKHIPDHRYRKLYSRVTGKTAEELFSTGSAEAQSPWPADGLNGQSTPDDQERLILATRRPVRIDLRVIDDLSTILAAQRRTEDAIGSAPLLAPVRGQLASIQRLVAEARGPLRPQMVDIAAQWAQFAGWLHIATGDLPAARTWLNHAAEWAIEIADGGMIGSVTSWKAYLAEQAGHLGAMIGMAHAAQRDRTGPGRAYDLHLEARGQAMTSDLKAAAKLLDQAETAVNKADPADARPWEYYYFAPGFFEMERGLVLRHMGQHDPRYNHQAIEYLTAGQAALPDDMRESEWSADYQYQCALAHAQAHDLDQACQAAHQSLATARATGSTRLTRKLRELHTRLTDTWPNSPAVAELGEALR